MFHAEDAYFDISIKGKDVSNPDGVLDEENSKILFDELIYRYNNFAVADLDDDKKPIYHLVSIDNVVAVKSVKNKIKKIAYSACIEINEVEVDGYLYIDDDAFVFYAKDYEANQTPLSYVEHKLGYCPVSYISQESFDGVHEVLRESIFSHIRSYLEDYDFLKTLLRMTEPNSVFPVVTILQGRNKKDNQTAKVEAGAPMTSNEITGQRPEFIEEIKAGVGGGETQAGTVHKIPYSKKDDGSVDMDLVKNYINFNYLDPAPLEYINKRIAEIEHHIIKSIVGIIANQNAMAKNETQVQSEYISKEDRLRGVSSSLTKLRTFIDKARLELKYGVGNVSVNYFYGSRFFMESLPELYDMIEKSPNPIESRNILDRISTIRNKFNRSKQQRETILYSILPYMLKADFEFAVNNQKVSDEVFQLQTMFDFWITKFEAEFGDIVVFWDSLGEMTNAEKTNLIKGLILNEVKTAIVPPNNNTNS